MYTEVAKCRVCGNARLEKVLELGNQALTGVFPKSPTEQLTVGPLTLVKCVGDDACGLLQLGHTYSLEEMYGDNYGYRSGLNPSMVAHLRCKVQRIKGACELHDGDVILDIGSNDATTLKQYELPGCQLVGIDPTGKKFASYYTDNIALVPDFFSAALFKKQIGARKAKVVTSFSMFYDLDDPLGFMREIADILAPDGIWVFEQSYMPAMLQTNSYDTVCHEHLEYYALEQINWMAQRAGLEIIDVELNEVNGGSFSVVVQPAGGPRKAAGSVANLLEQEQRLDLNDLKTYVAFADRVKRSRDAFVSFLTGAKAQGKRVAGLGASTKGNVVLQYCGVDASLIYAIGEVNEDKFGAFTPGTRIPIVDEKQVLAERPDYAVVLPWHFRSFFEKQERYKQTRLVFPLPELDVI
jgi:NDP-4-keto-2,6-dideoxyhexose 3-C-methyltransferase